MVALRGEAGKVRPDCWHGSHEFSHVADGYINPTMIDADFQIDRSSSSARWQATQFHLMRRNGHTACNAALVGQRL
jgi:hypothetical protein